ncbi:hypothetical protein Poly51_55670 [Rubripirellula tenax]|uniref:Uncharacterized protein n=1 Tax=Rubripirellula tenax TaxID=2528015 RepID=A0A5C6EB30_9BACT|nr:hypothetical protein Poly51_55670 [Rubripirellula tenax]
MKKLLDTYLAQPTQPHLPSLHSDDRLHPETLRFRARSPLSRHTIILAGWFGSHPRQRVHRYELQETIAGDFHCSLDGDG